MGLSGLKLAMATLSITIFNGSYTELIRRLQDKADPIGSVMLILGFFLVMLGQKDKGLKMVKWTVIAYIGIQFVPTIMKWIKDLARGGQ